MPSLPDLLGPDRPGNVDHHSTSVALTVDVAGAVKHLLEGGERRRNRLVAGRRVLLDGCVKRAGVPVLDGYGRPARLVPLR